MAYQLMPWVAKYKTYAALAGFATAVAIVPYIQSLYEISVQRENLATNNLYDATSEEKCATLNQQIAAKTANCQIGMKARMADGSCNNLQNPAMGMAGVRFGRNVPVSETFQEPDSALLSPNPREISRKLLTRTKFKPANIVNFAAAAWLQFMVHDWFNHGDNQNNSAGKLAQIPLTPDDPLAGVLTNQLTVFKTASDPNANGAPYEAINHKGEKVVLLKKGFKNVVTHWWDGSQIYGSDEVQLQKVRGDARLRGPGEVVVVNGNLPTDPATKLPVTGFNENWWIGLQMMHQLFILEHNSIARDLVQNYPESSVDVQKHLTSEYAHLPAAQRYDRYIFDKARLINVAVMAKIHTVEWTPAILKNPVLEGAMTTNWSGIVQGLKRLSILRNQSLSPDQRAELLNETSHVIPYDQRQFIGRDHTADSAHSWINKAVVDMFNVNVDAGIQNKQETPGIDFVAMDTGLVGTRTELYGVPFTLTEEFVSVYRMHSLLRDQIDLYNHNTGQHLGSVGLASVRNQDAVKMGAQYSPEDLWYSFGVTHPGALTLNNYPATLQNLKVPYLRFPFIQAIDMATVDILRDRERGVPRYNRLRRLLGMPALQTFEDFAMDPQTTQVMRDLYQNDIEKVDLLIGCLAESVRPDVYGFGETAFQIFTLMASRRLMADRFFSENYTSDVYTAEGLKWVDNATMKSVLLRHFPGLEDALSGAENGNAFRPWKGEINEN